MVVGMNLRAAQTQLHGRSPRATAPFLVLETLVVVSFSYLLVGIFA
jgi:hypothetical protein